jgi:hypothetical protein
MTPSQTVKEFCKRNSLSVDNKNKVVTISRRIVHDSWFIECFDSYTEALEYITKHENAYINKGTAKPWSTYNVK